MKPAPVKSHWLDRAIEVCNFHASQCRDESGWTIGKTAAVLNRSIGSVSQDILLARWSKTHDKQLRKHNSMKEALRFIHGKLREQRQEAV